MQYQNLNKMINDDMNILRWKLEQVYGKSTPKQFMKSISNKNTLLKAGEKTSSISPWALDIVLYVLLLAIVVAFVYIIMSFANDFKGS